MQTRPFVCMISGCNGKTEAVRVRISREETIVRTWRMHVFTKLSCLVRAFFRDLGFDFYIEI